MKRKFHDIKLQLDSLTVFSTLKTDPVMSKLMLLLDAMAKNHEDIISIYSDFVAELYPHTACLTDYIQNLIIQDDNFFIKQKAANVNIDMHVRAAVDHELSVLQNVARLKCEDVLSEIDYEGFLPQWITHEDDIAYNFMEKLNNIRKTGYGIFAKYNFFRIFNGEIIPVEHPDFQTIDHFFEYERERDLIIKNTEALIDGTGASNMLLYGDAGTGKSSTIKAVAANLAPRGLRIIEVKKNQLYQIPELLDELSSNPLKFIIFIDDLSFSGNDDNFSALKATLEGSISGTGDNAVIYATSNRRHLVKESFSDRTGDELHLSDTLQETMSLAARFGLTITFQKPGKDEYLSIVKNLATDYGIDMPEEELFKKAEAHAIRKNGRSPRTAKQFIELLKIGI